MNASLHFDKRMLSCIILRTLRSFVVYFSIFNLLGINFYASFEVGSNFFSLNNNFGGDHLLKNVSFSHFSAVPVLS